MSQIKDLGKESKFSLSLFLFYSGLQQIAHIREGNPLYPVLQIQMLISSKNTSTNTQNV